MPLKSLENGVLINYIKNAKKALYRANFEVLANQSID